MKLPRSRIVPRIAVIVATLLAVVSVAPAASAADVAGTYRSLEPVRLLDTRVAIGVTTTTPVAPNAEVSLQITGRQEVDIPANASAVVLNVTVTEPTASGWLTVYPTGANPRPWVSNLNFVAGQTVPNLAVVALGDGGKVNILNASPGTSHLVVDVSGYFIGGVPSAPGAYQAMSPERILDTREAGGAVETYVPLSLQVGGLKLKGGTVPEDISAVVLNLTVTEPTSSGFVSALPSGTYSGIPKVSSLNFAAGQTIANLVIVQVSAEGTMELRNFSTGTTHLVADIAGYFLGGDPTASFSFTAVDPTRIMDGRDGTGLGTITQVAANQEVSLQVTGGEAVEIPATASAVVLNVTVTQPETTGFITVYPTGVPRPNASNLNFVAGQNVANAVIVKLGDGGRVNFANTSGGGVYLIADVAGYFLGDELVTVE